MNAVDITIIRGRIAGAYLDLAAKAGDGEPRGFVGFHRLRAELPDIPRADLDAVLVGLYKEQAINMISAAAPWTRQAVGKAAAVRCGGDDKHMFSWRD